MGTILPFKSCTFVITNLWWISSLVFLAQVEEKILWWCSTNIQPKTITADAFYLSPTIPTISRKVATTYYTTKERRIQGTSGNKSALFSTVLEKKEQTVQRKPESVSRVQQVRDRCRAASIDAANAKGCAPRTSDGKEWWRTPPTPRALSSQSMTTDPDPLRVLVAGGGVAGLVVAAACYSKGMKVAIFEQANQYAPYGGPIQIQSNALRALQQINEQVYKEIVEAGTVTADRVSGLKIGYQKGVFLGLGKFYNKGDWLVQFDTLIPALQAGLPPTVVVDRPVIQQILLNHGLPEGTVRIQSRIANYEELGPGNGIKVVQVPFDTMLILLDCYFILQLLIIFVGLSNLNIYIYIYIYIYTYLILLWIFPNNLILHY